MFYEKGGPKSGFTKTNACMNTASRPKLAGPHMSLITPHVPCKFSSAISFAKAGVSPQRHSILLSLAFELVTQYGDFQMLPKNGDKKRRLLPKKLPPDASEPPLSPKDSGGKKQLLRKKLPQDVLEPPPLNNGAHQPVALPATSSSGELVIPGMVDALEKWKSDIEGPRQDSLQLLRLDNNDRLLVPFTGNILPINVHWWDGTNRGYYQCNGGDCILCRIGRGRQQKHLLPLYDVMSQTVGVLAISEAKGPNALRPKLMEMLEVAKANPGKTLLVTIRAATSAIYSVHWSDLPPGADDGRSVIKDFAERLQAGTVQLGSVYQKLSNEELASLPDIANFIATRGISL